jgi:integrase
VKSKYIDQEDVKKLREAMSAEEWLPLWISLETGLRVGDVVKLKPKDVQEDGLHYTAEKTGKKGTAAISQALRKELIKRKGKYIFPSFRDSGKHLTRQAVWVRVKRAGKRAGIELEGVSPHAMRKAFAVELYRKKGFQAVQKALQHNNSATTEIYSFADWDTGKNANLPLQRRDLKLIVRMVLEALGESYTMPKESTKASKEKGKKT